MDLAKLDLALAHIEGHKRYSETALPPDRSLEDWPADPVALVHFRAAEIQNSRFAFNSNQAVNFLEYLIKHLFSQAPGKRILLARMITAYQPSPGFWL